MISAKKNTPLLTSPRKWLFRSIESDFVTDLCGEDEIDVDDLIYQSVILNIPNPSVCDINCNGGALVEKYTHKEESDPRLDVFKNMKIKKEE